MCLFFRPMWRYPDVAIKKVQRKYRKNKAFAPRHQLPVMAAI